MPSGPGTADETVAGCALVAARAPESDQASFSRPATMMRATARASASSARG
jgi:hypothetical protein